jgi:hypothetical protein
MTRSRPLKDIRSASPDAFFVCTDRRLIEVVKKRNKNKSFGTIEVNNGFVSIYFHCGKKSEARFIS